MYLSYLIHWRGWLDLRGWRKLTADCATEGTTARGKKGDFCKLNKPHPKLWSTILKNEDILVSMYLEHPVWLKDLRKGTRKAAKRTDEPGKGWGSGLVVVGLRKLFELLVLFIYHFK